MKNIPYILVAFMLAFGFTATTSAMEEEASVLPGTTGSAELPNEKPPILKKRIHKDESLPVQRVTPLKENAASKRKASQEKAEMLRDERNIKKTNVAEKKEAFDTTREIKKDERTTKHTERLEERDAKKEELREMHTKKKAELAEKAAERATDFLDRILKRFRAAIARLEQITDRVDSRLTKIQEERGVDLSKAFAYIASARQELASATAALELGIQDTESIIEKTFSATEEAGLDASDERPTRPSFKGAQTQFREAHAHIKAAHKHLRDAVEVAKKILNERPKIDDGGIGSTDEN